MVNLKSFVKQGAEIRDLEYNDTVFLNEVSFWNNSFVLKNGITYTCDTVTILGGYNISSPNDWSQRNYTNLPKHNTIVLSLQFYRIDSFDANDKFKIEIDGEKLEFSGMGYFSTGKNYCGASNWLDLFNLEVIILKAHNSSSISITIINGCDESTLNESPGYRDISLVLRNYSQSQTTTIITSGYKPPSNVVVVPCNFNQYYISGSCYNCSSACKTCYNGTNSDCFRCEDGYYYVNNSCQACYTGCRTCLSASNFECTSCKSGLFLYEDGSCGNNCTSPYSNTVPNLCKCPIGMFLHTDRKCDYCISPDRLNGSYCLGPCEPGFYYYQDGICRNSCNQTGFFNYSIHENWYCNFTCSQNQYLFQNFSCRSSCPSSFSESKYSIGNYCNFICPSNTSLYENGSCISLCISPFQNYTFGIENYCLFPCGTNSYYYQNGTCLQNCLSPFLASNISMYKYCTFPCAAGSYLYQNGSCLTSCNFPHSNYSNGNLELYCNYNCPTNEYLYSNRTCKPYCQTPFFSSNISIYKHCSLICPEGTFYYRNESCLSSCLYPFRNYTVGIEAYCEFPCKTSEFYLLNGSCFDNCPSGFKSYSNSIYKYCYFPCDPGYFYYKNQTCLPFCNYPFQQSQYFLESYCEFLCPANMYLYSDKSCRIACPSSTYYYVNYSVGLECIPKSETVSSAGWNLTGQITKAAITTTVTSAGAFLFIGADPYSALAFLNILQSIFFILFYNVVYPRIVKDVLNIFSVSLLKIFPNPIEWFVDLPNLPSPKNFYENDYQGLLLDNEGSNILIYIAVIILYVVCTLLGKYLRLGKVTNLASKILRQTNKSVIMRLTINFYMTFMISSWLQILSADLNVTLIFISTLASFSLLIGGFLLPIIMGLVLSKPDLKYKKLKNFDALIDDYDINISSKRIFIVYVLIKRYIHSTAIVLLFYYPVFQTIIPWLLSLIMVILMIKLQPHHRMILNFFDTTVEIGFFMLHSAVLILAYYDMIKMENEDKRNLIGYLILTSIFIILVITFISVWSELYYTLREILKVLKSILGKEKTRTMKFERSLSRAKTFEDNKRDREERNQKHTLDMYRKKRMNARFVKKVNTLVVKD